MRDSVSARHRLEITLRFLATGESYRSLMYSMRVHESTISRFVPEVCAAIFKYLKTDYLQIPKTAEGWKNIAKDFNKLWQFPNCLGCMDGRHISFKPAASHGSYFFNYKGFHSIVLLGLCDARYRFIYVNVGVNGRVSDGGVFQQTQLAQAINNPKNPLNLPEEEALAERTKKVPYVIIADDAFPLTSRILKPYPQRGLTHDEKIFNYRLSRARRMIESCFGILANRFRVLLNPINLSAEKVEIIVLACVVLHNYLVSQNNTQYTDISREEVVKNKLLSLQRQIKNNSPKVARLVRDEFKEYFNTVGVVCWQEEAINKHNL